MGDDTIYSGTVAAAMEGYLFGIPAIAFSQVEKGWGHLEAAAQKARELVQRVLADGAGRQRPLAAQREHSQPRRLPSCGPFEVMPAGPSPCQPSR